ncbi:hypothetical protein [Pseudomonas palleroniana]|uniref:Uncharacterized protein n=1 Tax=Pseudomonas palleroniana TaxID=191390 RepID=A0A2L1J728_9PSED|nr:hypothetical protein [Pseudomonas palleroniana]AVE04256.1 hypothetical protein CYL20_06740 [Pseudomonas palleroniana]UOP10752.1 hypothetical protein LDL65_27380 [Pseudomonas palleroniana]
MNNIQSSPYSNTLQAAPEALRLRPEPNTPDKESNRITVREEDYSRVIYLLSEAAKRNGTQVTIGRPESSDLDYGDGPMNSETFSFNFHPDKADGSYSPKYLESVNKTNQLFENWMRIEGIRNYAPE